MDQIILCQTYSTLEYWYMLPGGDFFNLFRAAARCPKADKKAFFDRGFEVSPGKDENFLAQKDTGFLRNIQSVHLVKYKNMTKPIHATDSSPGDFSIIPGGVWYGVAYNPWRNVADPVDIQKYSVDQFWNCTKIPWVNPVLKN